MEKNSILSQLTMQRDEMTSLTNQLAEQQQRMVTMTAAKDEMSRELYSCQQSLVSLIRHYNFVYRECSVYGAIYEIVKNKYVLGNLCKIILFMIM